jgi:hypothetical protein
MNKYLVLLVILLVFLLNLTAERIVMSSSANGVKVISSNSNSSILQVEIASFTKEELLINGKIYYHISLENEGETYEKGAPQVPQVSSSIIIDNHSQVVLKITKSRYEEFHIDLAPSKGIITRDQDPLKVPYEFGDIYAQNSFYPSQLASLSEAYILRNYRGVTLTFSPFQYNPKTRLLRVYTLIQVEVSKTNQLGNNRLVSPAKNVKSFEMLSRNHFLNYQHLRYDPLDDFGSILVIAPENYFASMQIYANWKIQKGIPTEIVDVASIGNTGNAVKAYIQNYYNTHPDLAFVQIAGDASQVATLTSGGGGADPKYALVAGNDNYPDIFISRFSAETNSQLLTQIERSIHYERDLNSSATYLSKALGIASDQGGVSQGDNGESDISHMNIIRNKLLNYNYNQVDQVYDPNANSQLVATSLNEGRGLVNYIGHGSTYSWATSSFSNSNINALTNVDKLPFIVSVACLNGNFVNNTCFAEAWMRANHNEQASGAIAVYASSINQSWDSPMRGQDEINDLLVNESLSSIGGLFYSGACAMMDSYGLDGQNMYNTWHIFGDGSLQVRSDTPQSMQVAHAGIIRGNQTVYDIATDTSDALVALTYNNRIIASGYTDLEGNISLNLGDLPASPRELNLTITAFNRISKIERVSLLENYPNWQAVIYPNNSATIYAEVRNIGEEVTEEDIISVWVNNECRGLGQITLANNNQAYTSILVQSNGSLENASFKLYDRSADLVIEQSNCVSITSGQVIGSEQEPFIISLGLIQLPAPDNIDIEIINNEINITWTSVPQAHYYELYYSFDLVNWIELGQTSTNSYLDNQAGNGEHSKFYMIKAKQQ